MPDFLPTPQLPQGLMQEVLRLASQPGQIWGSALANLGQTAGSAIKERASRLTPEQFSALTTTPKPLAPGVAGPPDNPMARAFPNGLSPAAQSLAERLAMSRETTSRMMGVQTMKGEQAAAKDHTPATAELLKSTPKLAKMGFQVGDMVPNRFISEQTKPVNFNMRDSNFWEKQWVDTAKDMDLSKASSRTPLGVAVTNNQKANRAKKLLSTKGVFTPQDQSLVTTDLTAMMKGGSPDEELLRQQQYGNLQQKGVEILQKITSEPKNLNNPEIRQHLLEVINGIVDVDNSVIKGHIDSVESGRTDVIAKRPKDWEKLKAKALGTMGEKSDMLDALIDKHLGGK